MNLQCDYLMFSFSVGEGGKALCTFSLSLVRENMIFFICYVRKKEAESVAAQNLGGLSRL